MDEKICETLLTGRYVADHLQKALQTNAVLVKISGQRIAIGQGFGSHILRLRLEWENRKENEELPTCVVVKTPTVASLKKLIDGLKDTDNDQMTMVENLLTDAHRSECRLYEMFRVERPTSLPICYVCLPVNTDGPGMIIMEDMSETGSVIKSLAVGLNLNQVLNAVGAIAKLHGWCMTTSVDWKKNVVVYETRREMLETFYKQFANAAYAVKEAESEFMAGIDVDQVVKWNDFDECLEVLYAHRKMNIPDVIVHGDFWANNIMYYKDKDGNVTDKVKALIDFQGCHIGGPCFDVTRILLFSVKTKLRQEHADEILQHYYNELKAVVGQLNFSVDQLKTLYKQQLSFQAMQLILGMSSVAKLVEQEDKAQQALDEREIKQRTRDSYDEALLLRQSL